MDFTAGMSTEKGDRGSAPDEMERQESEDSCCAICFESRDFVQLPCACRVNYCKQCWDRALAASVAARGRARCPSCRAALHVEFDPESGGPIFARSTEAGRDDWRACLYSKARPVQIQLLQRFGSGVTKCSGCSEPRSQHEGHADAAASHRSDGVPMCICGAEMERITVRERTERVLRDFMPRFATEADAVRDQLVDRFVGRAIVTCDLCGHGATVSGSCWTCKNGQHTILHPTAYDVCDECFDLYTGTKGAELFLGRQTSGGSSCSTSVGAAPSSSSRDRLLEEPHPFMENAGCPDSFVALLRHAFPAWWPEAETQTRSRRRTLEPPEGTWLCLAR